MGDEDMDLSGQSPDQSPSDEYDDSQWQSQTAESQILPPGDSASGSGAKSAAPLQKRRRVTRACDECRRKKIKCDGKQPCTHCTVYSYDCTYDQPSNRRRNPAPQYIEALESRLQKAEALLRTVAPSINLDDPKFEARGIDQILAIAQRGNSNPGRPKPAPSGPGHDSGEDEARLETMIQNTGSLDLDNDGEWDYHGHSSGFAFLQRLRASMGDFNTFNNLRQLHVGRNQKYSASLDSPSSISESPHDSLLPLAHDLPAKEVAKDFCRNALDDCCALMRFIHQPTFYEKLEKIYGMDPEQYTNSEIHFLPLLYVVMAVGCMFGSAADDRLDREGYEKGIGQGYQFFNACRQMVDVTDCRDLTGLQTICFMILFLQSTAKLSTCYAYIGIALRTCLRLGLHRNVRANFDFIEFEQRKRIFWMIRKMDAYVGAMLGLPQMLSDEDIDQEYPTEVDDQYITKESIHPQPTNAFPLLKATNAHTRLVIILKKVVKYVYPTKGAEPSIRRTENNGYMISHSKIREIEGDLQVWMDTLPMELRPSDDAPHELLRVQQLLRIAYAHVQMMMYRPFLHYVSSNCQARGVDKRTFACAAACVSVSRNIVHITTEMKKRGLLIGAYWFVMYTTYFAIVSLVFFCLENPQTNTGREILKDAEEGRNTIASLARRSLAADRCTDSLSHLFKGLPEKIQSRKASATSTPNSQTKKRPPPRAIDEPDAAKENRSSPSLTTGEEAFNAPQRARTFPNDLPGANSKRLSAPNPKNAAPNPEEHVRFRPTPSGSWNVPPSTGNMTPDSMRSASEQVQGSPNSSNFDPAAGNPNLPDLKNVMFPSDNPFAYPNQPISSLEEGHFTTEARASYPPFYLPNSSSQQPNLSFENLSSPIYGNFPPFIPLSQPQTQMGGPGRQQPFPVTSGLDMGALPQNPMDPSQSEEYWAQMGSTRTGLTAGVNLDDLFGNGQWNPVWDNQGH